MIILKLELHLTEEKSNTDSLFDAVLNATGSETDRDYTEGLIKVMTDEGLVGWGEAHHGRCPGAISKLIDTTIKE